MTDERLELVRRSYEAFGRLDGDGVVQLFQPDCTWEMGPLAVVSSETEWRGHDGLRTFLTTLGKDFKSFETEILEWRWHGQRLLLRTLTEVETKTVAQPLGVYNGQVVEFRDGLMSRVVQTEDPPPGWDEAEPVPL